MAQLGRGERKEEGIEDNPNVNFWGCKESDELDSFR